MLFHSTEHYLLFASKQASTHAIGNTTRLVVNLLEHEMIVATLLQAVEVYVHFLHLGVYLLIVKVVYLHLLAHLEGCDLAVVEVDHLVGILHYRQGIGGEEEFFVIFAYAHNERT